MSTSSTRLARQWLTLSIIAVVIVVIETALSIAGLCTGKHYGPLITAALALIWAVVAVRQVRKLHALKAPRRCPDYSRIATLETGIYGQVFQHAGAPEEVWVREDDGTRYRADCVTFPPLETVADIQAAMDSLAERATAQQLCPCEGTIPRHSRYPHYPSGVWA